MSLKTKFIDVTADNITKYPQAICFINPKHEYFHLKIEWIKEQYKNGLKIKLLFKEGHDKPVGFIEYIPGENCWRSVDARGYMFIHCLWTYGKKHQHKGLGRILIEAVEKDAKNMYGVAVLTSDKSFMANKKLFIKNGYRIVSRSDTEQLLVKQFKNKALPSFNNYAAKLKKYKGLTIVYSKQCPWVVRFIEEIKPVVKKEKLDLWVIELKTAIQAQHTPSPYSVFNLIYNGRLLADRYISITRFKNILKKENKISH